MNIFTANKNWISGLGDLGPIGTMIMTYLGPILTFVLAIGLVYILISNVLPLMKKDTPPAEKAAAKQSLLWWGLGMAVILTAVAVVTGIFFGFGRKVQEASDGGNSAKKAAYEAIQYIHDQTITLKGHFTL